MGRPVGQMENRYFFWKQFLGHIKIRKAISFFLTIGMGGDINSGSSCLFDRVLAQIKESFSVLCGRTNLIEKGG